MRAPDDSHGPPPTLSDLLLLRRKLEQAWQQAAADQPAPDLRTYLPPASDPRRPAAIRELVSVDLEIRWRRKLPTTLEAYIRNYPELGGAAALPAELIYHEYRVRHQYGDKPSLSLYRERFPAQYQRLVELAQAGRGGSAAAASQRAALPEKKPSGTRDPAVPPGGASKRERPPAHEPSTERNSQASVSAIDASASPEAVSLPVLPYVPPLPPPAKDASATSEVETSGQEGGTVAPTPASGKKSGDILFPSDDEAPAGADPAMVPMVGGYRLLKRLGSGALGEVWKAEAPGGIEVAIKRLSRTLEAQEAQYERQSLEHVKRLRHRYLAQIHAYWVNKGRLYVVMELGDGSLLDRAEACRQQGLDGIPPDELLGYMREAAEALDFLHSEGIHHRDIKPANILLLNGHVKVADFGLARPLQEGESVINATFCGTPAYMAPELWENKFSTHSDQWSLAITYLELRLNRRPFKSRNVPSLMTEIRQGRIDLSPLPKAEQRVLRRALRQNPRDRYPNCTAFAEALEAAFRPPPPPPPSPRWLRTTIVLLACLVVGGLLASLVQRIIGQGSARVSLTPLSEELRVDTGGSLRVPIGIHREHYEGPIRLVFDPPEHPGVTIDEAEVSQGEESVDVVVHVDANARPDNVRIHLRTADAALRGDAVFELAILYLPRGYEAADKQTEKDASGVSYYKRIRRQLNDREQVEFVLIPRDKPKPGIPTFYISSNKITRGQFALFVAQKDTDKESKDFATDHENMPARGVTLRDAYGFANWLGGELPSLNQWDKTTGLWHPSRGQDPYWEGPYRGKWGDNNGCAVAVGLAKPLRIDDPGEKDDVSVYGCRGMAGNGREWTRTAIGREVSFEEIRKGLPKQDMILRGKNFEWKPPLTFDGLLRQREHEKLFLLELSTLTDPDLGFRVVLEPNR